MKKRFKREEIFANRGCYSRNDVENLSFINKKEITLIDILTSEISLNDKRWFLSTNVGLTSNQKVQLCLTIYKILLPIFKYDSTIKESLTAVEYFNNGNITEIALIEIKNNLLKLSYNDNDCIIDSIINLIKGIIEKDIIWKNAYFSFSFISIIDAIDNKEEYSQSIIQELINFVNNNE